MNLKKVSTQAIVTELRRRQAIAEHDVPASSAAGRRHRKATARRGAVTKTPRA